MPKKVKDPEEEEAEEEEEEEEKKKENEILVMAELPNQAARKAVMDDKEYDLITVAEALTEMRKDIKKIKGAVV